MHCYIFYFETNINLIKEEWEFQWLKLREKGVYVTVICPDLVDTPQLDLQLDYLEESAIVFSGPKPLSVVDVEKAFYKAITDPSHWRYINNMEIYVVFCFLK